MEKWRKMDFNRKEGGKERREEGRRKKGASTRPILQKPAKSKEQHGERR